MTSLQRSALAAALVLATGTPAVAVARQADSVRVCIADASTGAPLVGATLDRAGDASRMAADACVHLARGFVRIRRVGYRATTVDLRASGTVYLAPLAALATSLDTARIVADAAPRAGAGGRTAVTLAAADARERGASSVAQLAGLLPYTQMRTARGNAELSLRGARREQVLVTLDGLPLNDVATGTANLLELPLGGVGSATVSPGASAITGGPGAVGGVLALQSSTAPIATARVGGFGERAAEAFGRAQAVRALWHAGAAHRESRNDFPFHNTAGASGEAPLEHRVNNDDRSTSLTLGVIAPQLQLALTASHEERGMVGAMNVRTYDADRARNRRLTMRARSQVAATEVLAGVRAFSLAYRDPARPAFDSDADVRTAQLDATRVVHGVRLAAGGAADGVRTSTGVRQSRTRGYVGVAGARTAAGIELDAGARLDLLEYTGTLPSLTLAATRSWPTFLGHAAVQPSVRARVAQAVRAPTLYDLYFASPQRLIVRALDPERVEYDAEVAAALHVTRGQRRAVAEGALVSRRVRDAIIWFPGNFSWSPANVGTERLRGAEARATVDATPVAFSIWGTWYDARLASGAGATARDLPTPYVARTAAGATFTARPAVATLSLSARYTGARPYTLGPRDPAYDLPAVTLLDVALSRRHRLGPATALYTVSLDNAGDVAWQSVRGFPSPGRRWAIAVTLTRTPAP